MTGTVVFGLFLILVGLLGLAALRRDAFTADERQFPTHDGEGHVR